MEKFEELSLELKEVQANLNLLLKKPVDASVMESAQLDQLFTALAKAQGEMEAAAKDSENPFFKSRFADFASIVKASRPYLAKNGLCCIQRILPNGNGSIYLSSRLGHSSGQFIDSKIPIAPAKTDIQSIGSYITYLKRYTYAALVGVVTTDEDDDGEDSMERDFSKISEQDLEEIEQLLKLCLPEERANILKWAQISNLKDLTKEKYETVRKTLRTKAKR